MVSANQYEFKEGDEVFGPCTAHDLSDLASNGSLTATGFVRRIGTDRWIPAAKVKGLTFGQSSPENPTPGTPQSNTPVAHMQNYYVYDSSQQVIGPYSVVEVRQQLEDQTLDLNTRVCLEGTEEWEAIGEVPVLLI